MGELNIITTELTEINKLFSNYQSGDLLLIADIQSKLENLKNKFASIKSLKKIATLISYMSQILKQITLDKNKEEKGLPLIINLVKLLNDFFSKSIGVKDFSENITLKLPAIKELLFSKEKKEENFYSEDYFDNIVEDEKLLNQFYDEANEHLDMAQYTLVDLEYDSTNKELINNIFRNFHTIKGSSAFLGLKNIEEVSHKIEDLFDLVRKEKIRISKELIDVIFFGMSLIRTILDAMMVNNFKKEDMKKSFVLIDIFNYIELMKRILSQYEVKKIGEILEEFGKISKSQLDEVLKKQKEEKKKFGEIVVENKIVNQEDIALALKKQEMQKIKARSSGYVRVSNERLNVLIDIVGELVINQSMLKQEIVENNIKLNDSERNLTELENITKMIKNLVLSMGMFPISDVFNKLRVVARNTANELGKTVIVSIEGAETELDKNVLEIIYDPLIHIVRNAIDHGIENSEEREKKGKNKVGKILLKADHKGSGIEIIIADDGKGIDKEKIVEKALKLNLISKDKLDMLTERDIYNFLFLPGFSTSENVTNVSGRGVGLDVVKKNIEQIHGRVEIISEKDKGTTFIIKLPLTLAIIEGFVTKVNNNKYVFPFNLIDEILVLNKEKIIVSQSSDERLIFHRGGHIPVIFLQKILKGNIQERSAYLSVIINFDNSKYCIVVDEIIGKQEIVVKNLGKILNKNRIFSGGTIFGDGSIGFVIDVQNLIESVISK
ncbi:MAG TPA: chemotaxis protein CheA [Spirochaetota bacterium]|nr:chemotaxis protein CheA [Spirochaetota bacterium]